VGKKNPGTGPTSTGWKRRGGTAFPKMETKLGEIKFELIGDSKKKKKKPIRGVDSMKSAGGCGTKTDKPKFLGKARLGGGREKRTKREVKIKKAGNRSGAVKQYPIGWER